MFRANNHDSKAMRADSDSQVVNYHLASNHTTTTDVDSHKSAGLVRGHEFHQKPWIIEEVEFADNDTFEATFDEIA